MELVLRDIAASMAVVVGLVCGHLHIYERDEWESSPHNNSGISLELYIMVAYGRMD